MNKKDLDLDKLQELICHKTQPTLSLLKKKKKLIFELI